MNMQKIERVFEKGTQLVKNPPFATKELEKNPLFRRFYRGKILYGFFRFIHEVDGKSKKSGKITQGK